MDIPPLIQVSHLPSASSFYASLTQPLGLQFLVAAPISPATLHFGFVSNSPSSSGGLRKQTVFTVSEAPVPRLAHITLSAPSSKAILEFHQKSTVLNRDHQAENTLVKTIEDERAVTKDFDGNMIEAVYVPRARGVRGGGAVTLETASSQKEAKRVLEWQEDVARSISEEPDAAAARTYSHAAPRPGSFQRADTFPRTRPRRGSMNVDTFKEEDDRPRDRSPVGISGNAILGTMIAAAAGSALIYSFVKSRPADPPPRRRTSETHYTHSPIRMEDREQVVERIPARSHLSQREQQDKIVPRYVQDTVSKPPVVTSREVARIDDRSYVSGSTHREDRRRGKSRSEIGTRYERPLSINPAPAPPGEKERERETQSHVSTRSRRSHHRDDSSPRDREQDRERRYQSRDRSESYASARSHHTASTVKPAPPILPSVPKPPPATSYVSPSKSERRPSVSRSHVSERPHERDRDRDRDRERRRHSDWDRARMVPLPESVVSARQVPLPRSTVGYEYEASVAPSDSVSSVGMKRERERLRERMRERGLAGRWDA